MLSLLARRQSLILLELSHPIFSNIGVNTFKQTEFILKRKNNSLKATASKIQSLYK